jgi:ribonuclease-3
MQKDFSDFEKEVNIEFKDKKLLLEAFTHRSYLNEHRGSKLRHNERLEFLGDAVLELAVTRFLYEKYPDKTEGDLTSYRAALVNAVTLSGVAKKIHLNKYLMLSKGEAKDEGRARDAILANTFESVVGALYLDQGFDVAADFIAKYVYPLTEEIVAQKLWLDAKSHFQEKAQEHTGITPSYQTMEEVGPDHDKCFKVGVYLGKDLVAGGEGRSKQEAEQSAARRGLEKKGWL